MSSSLTVYESLKTQTARQRRKGFSALCCPCGQMLTRPQEDYIQTYGNEATCSTCGKAVWIENVSAMVEPDSVAALDAKKVLKRTWYHSTMWNDWMTRLLDDWEQTPLVHIGSKESALSRSRTEGYEFLYTLSLKPETTIYDKIAVDNNSWTPYVQNSHPFRMPADAVRYLNVWESPGSISMLIDPRVLRVIKVEKISASDRYAA